MRIVSTLASGTEIACELGLEESVVGISHECDYPPDVLDRPRVSRPRFDPAGLDSGEVDRAVRATMAEHGSVYEIDAETLRALRPDLILSQAVCEVCAVPTPGVRQTVEALGLEARVLSLDAHSLKEILDTVRAVGRAAGVEGAAEARVAELEGRLVAVRGAVSEADPVRVLAIEWLDPPFAPGHWVPEMVEWAGGVNLVGAARRPSRQVEWSDLDGLEPEILVVMPCGYGLEAARRDADRHAERLSAVAGSAIDAGRAFVVDASAYFNRSGPRVVRGIEILAGLLHPDRWPPPGHHEAGGWAPSPASPSATGPHRDRRIGG